MWQNVRFIQHSNQEGKCRKNPGLTASDPSGEANMKWITRERPKIDRIACPCLIKNFVDRKAEFIYVPKEQVLVKAQELDAIPYDIPGAEYSPER